MPIALYDIPEQASSRWMTAVNGHSFKQDLAGRGSDDKEWDTKGVKLITDPCTAIYKQWKDASLNTCLLDEWRVLFINTVKKHIHTPIKGSVLLQCNVAS